MQRRHLLSGLLVVPALGAVCVALPSGGARAARGNVVSGFPGIEGWLNAPAAFEPMASGWPATLVNFWTYSCINARRTLPYLRR